MDGVRGRGKGGGGGGGGGRKRERERELLTGNKNETMCNVKLSLVSIVHTCACA